MDVKQAIEERRSIRKYTEQNISVELINELLDAARKAPSAKNVQSHRYFIVKDRETKAKLVENGVFRQSFVSSAPVIVVCCADPSQYPERVEVDDTAENYAHIDLAIATSFMTLRATELGLGTVFVAWINREKIKEILGIPSHYIIPFVIPIGYPAENPAQRARKNIEEIVLE